MGSSPANGGREPVVSVSESDLVYQGCFISRPSKAVIEALVTVEETELTNLPVIYSVIDLDSLDDLYRNPDQMQYPAEVSFCIGEYRFFLSSDGFVEVYDLSESEPQATGCDE